MVTHSVNKRIASLIHEGKDNPSSSYIFLDRMDDMNYIEAGDSFIFFEVATC